MKKKKKIIIFAGIGAVGLCGGYLAIKRYGSNNYISGFNTAKEEANRRSYNEMKADIIDSYLDSVALQTKDGSKISIFNKQGKLTGHFVAPWQRKDYVDFCIRNYPEIEAHLRLRYGNPAAEVRTF